MKDCECDSYTPTGKEKYIYKKNGFTKYYQEQKCDICGNIFCEEFTYHGNINLTIDEVE